jgi:hypothetical protein
MKNQLVNFVEVNFEEVKSFFYNDEKNIINELEDCSKEEKNDLIEFLDEQMNISTSLELIEVINERSLGVDLDSDDECEGLFEMIRLYIS